MGQVLHGSATTIEAVRRAIQQCQVSPRDLARHYRFNPKTIAKWRRCTSVADLPTRSHEASSFTLSAEEKAIIVAFRRDNLLPLDDCLYALQATIPLLTRLETSFGHAPPPPEQEAGRDAVEPGDGGNRHAKAGRFLDQPDFFLDVLP